MQNIQTFSDKFAISLSALCLIHCLALPLVVVFLPNLAALPLENEAFHKILLILAIPVSIYALCLGCKKHQRYQLFFYGITGLTLLVLAIVLSELFFHGTQLGETTEKSLSTLGAILIAYGHYKNYRMCNEKKSCDCNEKPSNA